MLQSPHLNGCIGAPAPDVAVTTSVCALNSRIFLIVSMGLVNTQPDVVSFYGNLETQECKQYQKWAIM